MAFPSVNDIKPRKPQADGANPHGLARRATDQELRGMNVLEDNSELAWDEFEKALNDSADPDSPLTQPGEPGERA